MHARDRGGQGTLRRLARKMPIRVKRAGVSLGQAGGGGAGMRIYRCGLPVTGARGG